MSSSELESRRDEEERNDWMEDYLKSRGLRDLVVVPCSSEASLNETKVSVAEKMIKHNIDAKKKKLIKSIKDNEKNEWTGAYRNKK
jgi:predicted GIY-YIG superfamily endonuclease